MGLSHTAAIERDVRRARIAATTLGVRDAIMPLTSLVAILAIALAYSGRLRATDEAQDVLDVNAISSAERLELVLQRAFSEPADRRLAVDGLTAFLAARREAATPLPNIGALLEATLATDAIARTPASVVYAERLRAWRAAAPDRGVPATLALLTSDDLARIKPALAVRSESAFARLTLVSVLAYLAAFHLVVLLWRMREHRGDLVLLAAVHLLTAVGFALLVSRPDPLRDSVLFVRYTVGVVLGLGVLAAASLADVRKASFVSLSYLPLAGALLLSLLLVVFGHGPGTSRARVNLGPVQPIEAIRLLLALFLAGYFAQRWEVLRQITSDAVGRYRVPRWLHVPRLEYVLPILVGVGAAWLFFFLQRDLGPALFLACVFLSVYAVARARVLMAIVGVALLLGGFYVGYRLNLSDTLSARVAMWQSPWDNAVRGGDQVAQSIWAVATGGWFGSGLGLGDTRYLPAGHTDLVLSAIGEELGFLGLLAIAALYVLIAARGLAIALRASTDYGYFLATCLTLFLTVPVLMMAAGVFGLTPLTGVVTPFLSYGGSAMVANLAALGLLIAIGAHVRRPIAEPFRRPTMYLGGGLGMVGFVLLAAVWRVGVLSADELAIRPHLSLQGDGVRRYQYNPRVLDAARAIPRGSIVDRRGLPLATADAATMERARAEYAALGVSLARACPQREERCYPLGGAAFHVLGNAVTRVNWSAANTSYIERDAEDRLRGFDDRATTVAVADREGHARATVRRDYRDVLPLLRHRHEPTHSAVQAVLAANRDLRTTIDARLQLQVAAILERVAARTTTRRAAAVVIDPDTGHLLASVGYPFPQGGAATETDADAAEDSLLDRARYGLYPPGSTFKLVTAAAALGQHLDPDRTTFACAYLPHGRVGAHIDGWSRPVRDDVLDRQPHGRLGLHDGIVHSCNAYFAQLAVRLGPAALMRTAAQLGISTAPDDSVKRLRDTLPQAGYGQGDVVATPLRMARVAAAIANGGTLAQVSWDAAAPKAAPERLLPASAARLLGRYMRDAVLTGTGRALRQHPMRIAGKTGTAEVAGAASHSWFVGFAPFDTSEPQVAFAVIVENAGYGAAAAVPVAGEIVSAASRLGLIR
jgi:cell division protein FtsW (lipid II flippase)